MFKRFLLFSVSILCVTIGFAQGNINNHSSNLKLNTIQVGFEGLKSKGIAGVSVNHKAPVVNNGVWYAKPEGTFYKNGYPSASLVVPPLTSLNFINKCNNVATSSWIVEGDTVGKGTEVFQTVYPAMRETAFFPVPQISVGKNSFALGRTVVDKVSTDGRITTKETIDNLSKTDYVVGGSYIGWANFPGFPFRGSNDFDGDGVKENFVFHTFVQHYPKPASPFALTSLLIPFSSYQTAKDMIPEGKEITVRIDKSMIGNTVVTGHITKGDVDETKWIEDPSENVTYASPVVSFDVNPLILDDEFFIVIEGLEDCEQMGFWVTLPALYEQEIDEKNVTRTEGIDENGEKKQTSWSYSDGKNVSYWEAVIYLMGMFDVAQVDTNLVAMNVSANGGVVTVTYAQGDSIVEDSALIFRSSRPYFSAENESLPNYDIEVIGETADWLKIKSVVDTEDKLTRIMFEAEPYNNPSSEGREVSLRIKSNLGACTETLAVRQIPMAGDQITILSEDGKNITFTIIDIESMTCEINDMDVTENGEIIIPDSVGEFRVLGIADGAFAGHEDLTEVSINFVDSLGGTIGKEIFKDCPALEKITIGENVCGLNDSVFVECKNLKTIVSLVNQDNLWAFNENVFDAIVYENATLIVPEERVGQYQVTDGWNHFQTIMDPETALGINMPNTNTKVTNVYLLDGRRTDKVRSGVNIIKMSDGTIKKVTVK